MGRSDTKVMSKSAPVDRRHLAAVIAIILCTAASIGLMVYAQSL